jgi:glycosyl transferase family 4
MTRLGWDASAVSMLPLDVSFDGLARESVATASLGMRQGQPDPAALFRFAQLLRDQRPDVLHAHMVHANLLARVSRLLWRTPVVVSTMHNQYQGAY